MIRDSGGSVESDTIAESTLLQTGRVSKQWADCSRRIVEDSRILGLRREVGAVDRVRRHWEERLRDMSQHFCK